MPVHVCHLVPLVKVIRDFPLLSHSLAAFMCSSLLFSALFCFFLSVTTSVFSVCGQLAVLCLCVCVSVRARARDDSVICSDSSCKIILVIDIGN